MTIITGKTPGPFKLCIIDSTQDVGGFEHAMTERIFESLAKCGVPLVGNSPYFPRDMSELATASKQDFNCLLYIAHGDQPGANSLAPVQIGADIWDWSFFKHLDITFRDKLVCLGVCHGYNKDAISILVHDTPFALTILAPNDQLAQTECEAFFVMFFCELHGQCQGGSIDPNLALEITNKFNNLSNGKMIVYSLGFSY